MLIKALPTAVMLAAYLPLDMLKFYSYRDEVLQRWLIVLPLYSALLVTWGVWLQVMMEAVAVGRTPLR